MTSKICTQCEVEKAVSEFNRTSKGRPDSLCKICHSARGKDYYARNKEKVRDAVQKYRRSNLDKSKEQRRKYQHSLIGKYRTLKAKTARRQIECNISLDDYVHTVKDKQCYYCNGPLSIAGYSLDRIDNTKGYLINNVRPCCRYCNQAKMNLTERDFLDLIKNIYLKHCVDK